MPDCVDTYFPDEIFDIEDPMKRQRHVRLQDRDGLLGQRGLWAQGVFNKAELHTDIEKLETWMRGPRVRRLHRLLYPVCAPGEYAADRRTGRPKISDLAVPE